MSRPTVVPKTTRCPGIGWPIGKDGECFGCGKVDPPRRRDWLAAYHKVPSAQVLSRGVFHWVENAGGWAYLKADEPTFKASLVGTSRRELNAELDALPSVNAADVAGRRT